MDDKVKLSASEVETLKKNMESWQSDLTDINKRLDTVGGNLKQVELGSVSVDKAGEHKPADPGWFRRRRISRLLRLSKNMFFKKIGLFLLAWLFFACLGHRLFRRF